MAKEGLKLSANSICRRHMLQGLGGASLLTMAPGWAWAQTPLRATMAYGSTGYTWSTSFLADALNTWKQSGLELKVVDFPTGRDAMQALLAGSAEFSTATETPIIFAALRGLKPIIVVNYSRYSFDMKIVVRKDRGIDTQQPASLKGRKIATQIGTSGQYMLARYCEMAGINVKDLTIVNMAPADMITATVRGDVDGFSWTREAAITANRQAPGATALMKQTGLERYFRSHQLLLTTERVVKERPEILDSAVKALFAAEEYMVKNANWPELITKRVGNTAEEIREGTAAFEFRIEFDDRFISDLVTEAEWAISAGLASRPKEDLRKLFRGLIHEGPVKKYRPDRVTLASS